jgi:alkylation response protein AidB-like acyl-CoA dehydrogenase
VLIPSDSAGLERAPFWKTTALAAAESDQVALNQVFVPDGLIFYPQDGESMDPIQARGFVWFELLVSASYLGAATNLAERAIERVVMSATATLGGMSFIESPEIAYLLGVTRALAFHPPSRAAAAGPVARYLAGGPLTLLSATAARR